VLALAMASLAGPSAKAQRPSASRHAAVVALSAAYAANALWGAHVAIRDSLPEAPFGLRSHRSVRSDFLAGFGTALSPGLPMLVMQAGATALTSGSATTARRATGALAIAGVLYAVGQLSEPEALRVLRHPRAAPRERLTIVIANVVVPSVLTAASIQALR
jgi:hypothetical protein